MKASICSCCSGGHTMKAGILVLLQWWADNESRHPTLAAMSRGTLLCLLQVLRPSGPPHLVLPSWEAADVHVETQP